MPGPNEDNWEHRSVRMRCLGCMWFVEKRAVVDPGLDEERTPYNLLGRCRRHAPTLSGWPVVFSGDWCGDHKIDENK